MGCCFYYIYRCDEGLVISNIYRGFLPTTVDVILNVVKNLAANAFREMFRYAQHDKQGEKWKVKGDKYGVCDVT